MKCISNVDSVGRPLIWIGHCLDATDASSQKSKNGRSIDIAMTLLEHMSGEFDNRPNNRKGVEGLPC